MDFNDLLSRLNAEFEAKSADFERYSRQMAENHAFLSNWYGEMQQKLNAKNDQILQERIQWEKAKEEIRKLTKLTGEVIPLNVGGTHHLMTELDVLTLCPGSLLANYFSGSVEIKKVNEEYFLDRDGKTFLDMINYLRNNREVFPDFHDRNDEIHFFEELKHWGIPIKQGIKMPRPKIDAEGHCKACCGRISSKSPDTRASVDINLTNQKYQLSQQTYQPQPSVTNHMIQTQNH